MTQYHDHLRMIGHGIAGQAVPEAFLLAVFSLASYTNWGRTWLVSGAAPLTYLLLEGQRKGKRVLYWIPLPLLITLTNLAEAAVSTSWLFYWIYAAICWALIFVTCLYQVDIVADYTRKGFRFILHAVHFTADKVAIFDIPALHIDVDVDGLMIIRGLTFSLSTLTLTAHGIEVGIKISDDLELSIQADSVKVALFREIEIGDVYGNAKGGSYEQAFGHTLGNSHEESGQALMKDEGQSSSDMRPDSHDDGVQPEQTSRSNSDQGTPEQEKMDYGTELMTESASTTNQTSTGESFETQLDSIDQEAQVAQRADFVTMKDRMTDGRPPEDTEPGDLVSQTTHYSVDDGKAKERFLRAMDQLETSSEIRIARDRAMDNIQTQRGDAVTHPDLFDEEKIRAAVCNHLRTVPSIQHPSDRSIRVTTLQNFLPASVRRVLHRMPQLLRLLLNPLAYFHPVKVTSITVGASGQWFQSILASELFKGYVKSSVDVRKLRDRVFEWLTDANFVIGLHAVKGVAQVPLNPSNQIDCRLSADDASMYRVFSQKNSMDKIIEIGGADATFLVPSFLLPHHEHLLPSQEEQKLQIEAIRKNMRNASKPKMMQARRNIEMLEKDETQVQVSSHIRLPTCFDQDLLNFVSALVKASKIVEFEKSFGEAMTLEVRNFKELTKLVTTGMKESVKKTAVNAAANDRWIATLVGKITTRLETMHGDIGYTGIIPVKIKPYRDAGEPMSKLLP